MAAAGFLLRNPNYLRYFVSRLVFVLGWQVQTIALLTQTPRAVLAAGGKPNEAVFALGLIGLFQFLPLVALSLVGGQAADRFDRKIILALCYATKLAIAASLATTPFALSADQQVVAFFCAAAASGAVNAFQPAAQQALLPMVVSRDDLPRAIPLNSFAFTVGAVAGPGLGGALLTFGPSVAFGAAAGVMAIGVAAILTLRVSQADRAQAEGPALALIKEGLVYVWKNKLVLGAASLDLVVVLLAGAQALIPFFAEHILNSDEAGAGWLRSAMAVGAACTAIFIVARPLRRHVGRWMFGSTLVFSVAITIFGLSTSYWLSFAMLVVAGAADMISVQVRQSLIQLATPQFMLGRVAAVSFIFVSASNELGDFEAGLVGALLGPALGVATGGAAAFVSALLWMRLFPQLANADTYEDPVLAASRKQESNGP